MVIAATLLAGILGTWRCSESFDTESFVSGSSETIVFRFEPNGVGSRTENDLVTRFTYRMDRSAMIVSYETRGLKDNYGLTLKGKHLLIDNVLTFIDGAWTVNAGPHSFSCER